MSTVSAASATASSPHRAELKRLASLGAPIVLAQLFMMAMHVVDTVMAGRYSAADLAGVALAGSVIGPVMILLTGVLGAITPVTAQLFGGGKQAEIGHIARQGLWLGMIAAVATFIVVSYSHLALGLLNASPEMVRVASGYLEAVRWGYPGMCVYIVFRGVCEGMGRTRPAMVIAGSLLGVNALLNYAFIYGAFGAPELGGVGCGVATAIVMWLTAALIVVVVTRRFYASARLFRGGWRGGWRPDLATFARLARIGIPIGVTVFFEFGVFSLITLLLAEFGANVVAGHTIAMNINGLAFMIPMSLGMAASIRVGHCVGAENFAEARVVGQTALRASFAYAALAGLAIFPLRSLLVGLYTESPDVIAVATNLLIFVAAYQLVDDTQATAIGVQRGYKDTKAPMWLALTGYWVIGLPIGLSCGYGWLGLPELGVYGFWIGLAIGLTFVAICVNVRRIRFATDIPRIRRYAADAQTA